MSSGGESLSSVRPFGPVEEFVAEAAKDSSLEGGLHLADASGVRSQVVAEKRVCSLAPGPLPRLFCRCAAQRAADGPREGSNPPV
jgi:hypothetical protein